MPNENHVHVGQNGGRYILRLTEHASAYFTLLSNKFLKYVF